MKNPTKQASKIILVMLVCILIPLSLVCTVSAQSTVVSAEASASQPKVGDNLTVYIKISGAQNLYGVDVTLDWNPAVLKLVDVTPQLGVESHSGGVLHESSTYPIEMVTNVASQSTAEYHLSATSTGSSTPGFSGSGTMATVDFIVTSTGSTGLTLDNVELATKGSSDVLVPSTTVAPVTISGTPSASPSVPELPTLTILALVAVLATVTIIGSIKLLKRKTTLQQPSHP
jgi:hypothetical protein